MRTNGLVRAAGRRTLGEEGDTWNPSPTQWNVVLVWIASTVRRAAPADGVTGERAAFMPSRLRTNGIVGIGNGAMAIIAAGDGRNAVRPPRPAASQMLRSSSTNSQSAIRFFFSINDS